MQIRSDGGAAQRLTGNLILRRLSPVDRAALAETSETIHFDPHAIILDIDEAADALYFPNDFVVHVRSSRRSQAADAGMIGREGMFGWARLLGCDRSADRIRAGARGCTVVKIDCNAVEALAGGDFRATLLRFVQTFLIQLAQQVESSSGAPLGRRLAGWLLMQHDRTGGDELHLQHDHIADSLGVRRASVTDAFHRIEGERLVRCQRGRILIRDRAALEVFAGDSYGEPERLYRELIGAFGKTAHGMISPVGELVTIAA